VTVEMINCRYCNGTGTVYKNRIGGGQGPGTLKHPESCSWCRGLGRVRAQPPKPPVPTPPRKSAPPAGIRLMRARDLVDRNEAA
jgi:hypothetical protein